ncbi:MAG: hypothetical protein IPK19_29625 [Chloroflexi bacterium]|nr:hypothetical protein [Chloroflexota bacterium]
MVAMRRFSLLVVLLLGAIFALDQERVDAQTGDCAAALPGFPDNGAITFYRQGTREIIRRDILPYMYNFEYSPDCRFVIGHSLGYDACFPGLIIWDAATGERLREFRGMCNELLSAYPRLFWRPDNAAVLVSTWYRSATYEGSTHPQFIWTPATDRMVELEQPYDYQRVYADLYQVYWDDRRGWIWSSGRTGVAAFDTTTGRQVISFDNVTRLSLVSYAHGTASRFAFSPDLTQVIVYGQRDMWKREEPALVVYDIATGVGTEVNPERNAAGMVALSPDNRYLIMTYTAIRVWDLWNLPETFEARLPVYRFALPGDNSEVYFVNSTTVAARSGDVVYEWDLVSGQRIR